MKRLLELDMPSPHGAVNVKLLPCRHQPQAKAMSITAREPTCSPARSGRAGCRSPAAGDSAAKISAGGANLATYAPSTRMSVFEKTPKCPARRDLPPPGPLLEPLSKVELEILSLINRGLTNQEIANRLA